MVYMKNVQIAHKLRQLTKLLAVNVVFIVLGFAATAFRSSASDNPTGKRSSKDSALTDKNSFPNLLPLKNNSNLFVVQLNSQAVPFVQNYIAVYGKEIERIKIWGKRYLDLYDKILPEYGVPVELKYLSVIESNLKSGVVSIAGAVGPWQIMDFEARRVGLVVNGRVDERNSYQKSTHAAGRILKGLYKQFDDWLLVIAAYNAGAGRVNQAIRKSGSRNFWALQQYLPRETRNHVKKFIGTHYIFEGNGGLTTMTASEVDALKESIVDGAKEHERLMDDENFTKFVEINGKYNAAVIARNIGMDILLFNKFNPNFDKQVVTGNYKLRLPVEKMQAFDERKQVILNESLIQMLKSSTL
jgi:membrane-bound lytic murein transglycosylase D